LEGEILQRCMWHASRKTMDFGVAGLKTLTAIGWVVYIFEIRIVFKRF
jgi:hypothetical protein